VWIVDIPPIGEKPSGWDIVDTIAEGLVGESLAAWVRKKSRPHAAAAPAKPPTETKLLWKKGELVACLANIFDILMTSMEWQGVIAYDEFSQRTVKLKPPPFEGGQIGEWDGADDLKTTVWLTRNYGMVANSGTVSDAIEMYAKEHTFHPVRNWLRGLPKWDGISRQLWLCTWCGAEQSIYTHHVGRYFPLGMIARVMEPGIKFDTCLVLEGEQGKGKSSVISVLGGEWYGDTDLDLQNKDAMSSLLGKWVYEFPELGALAKAESTRQKSFLSRQFDDFRPVYGRRNIRCARQTVFCGTTNEWEWNKDPTGGRRFWPIQVGEIDLPGLKQARDQIFAEALYLYDKGERYWPSKEEQTKYFDPEQLKIEQPETLVDALHDWVYEQIVPFSVATAVMTGLKLDASKLTPALTTRVGIALRKLGCTKVEKRNGMTRFWYEPPKKSATSTAGMSEHPWDGRTYGPF
jgi:predicted P-loop ATPase